MAAAGPGEVRVKALYVYPVKSCQGIQVPKAYITHTGVSLYKLIQSSESFDFFS